MSPLGYFQAETLGDDRIKECRNTLKCQAISVWLELSHGAVKDAEMEITSTADERRRVRPSASSTRRAAVAKAKAQVGTAQRRLRLVTRTVTAPNGVAGMKRRLRIQTNVGRLCKPSPFAPSLAMRHRVKPAPDDQVMHRIFVATYSRVRSKEDCMLDVYRSFVHDYTTPLTHHVVLRTL